MNGYIQELGEVADLPSDSPFEVYSTNDKGHIVYQAYLTGEAAEAIRLALESIELQRKLGALANQFKEEQHEEV